MSSKDNAHPREQLTSRAIIVWGAAVLFYIVAIFGRSSFGVAGVAAIEHFEVDASRIAVFTAVQVGAYALAQIPTGLLVDRFGPRKVLIAGAMIMAVGQIILGLTSNYWVAIVARAFIGAGDATAFLSALRILPYWFPLKWTPVFTQLTASLGQLGQFISAVPFLILLNAQGWTVAFAAIGITGLVTALIGGIAIADAPAEDEAGPTDQAESNTAFRAKLSTVLRHPACWQAFFIHYCSMLWATVFNLLWGAPIITLGMGLSDADVGTVLTIGTLAMIFCSPLMGFISQRAGKRRDLVALCTSSTICLSWVIFFAAAEARSLAALIVVVIIMNALTGTSNYGFDTVREVLPRSIVATGTGLGNMGAFIATMVAAQTVGWILDHSAESGHYQWQDFRLAWASVIAIFLIGAIGVIWTRILLQRRLAQESQIRIISDSSPNPSQDTQ